MTEKLQELPALTQRQEKILSLIVDAYTHSPEPISSNFLVKTYDLSFSSATIRNEMSKLEDMGYVHAPHTSAGRVPTTDGYRYVVQRLIQDTKLTPIENAHITTRFDELPMVLDQWLRQAATILARTVHSASLVTPPSAETSKLKHIELISIQGRLVLMVLVLQGGTVHQRMITLAEPLSQIKLSETANRLNEIYNDLSVYELQMKSVQLNVLEQEITDLILDIMGGNSHQQIRVLYRDGLSDTIGKFSDPQGAKQAVRVFEERAFLSMILTEILVPMVDAPHDVQVMIAGDGIYEELNRLSIVISHYGVPGTMTGTVGVLGPTYLNYGRAISTVRHVSGLLTGKLEHLYDQGTVDLEGGNPYIDD